MTNSGHASLESKFQVIIQSNSENAIGSYLFSAREKKVLCSAWLQNFRTMCKMFRAIFCTVAAIQKPLKFIHITKTGGSSIETLGQSLNQSWGMFHSQRDKRYGFWHTLHDLKPPSLIRSFDWFMFVRNPFDRIVSEYWCEWGGRGKTANATVKQFNSFLRKRIASHSNDNRNGHYTRQILYIRILNIHPDIVLRIGRFESFEEDLRRIFGLYGIQKSTLPHANANHKHFNVSHLDDKTIELIRRTYKSDFEVFGYDLNPQKADSRLWRKL